MAKILSVDDSKVIREMVSIILGNAGYEVDVAASGAEALEKLKSGLYDMVLCDINMPDVDGIKVLTEARLMPRYRNTPIVMLTTEGNGEKKQRAKEAGATGWLLKPFNEQRVLAAVQKLVR